MIKKAKSIGAVMAVFGTATLFAFFLTAYNTPSKTVASQESPGDLPDLDILLRVLKGEGGTVSHIEVVLEMSSIERKEQKPFALKAPVIFAGVDGIADRIEQLRVVDDKGDVELKMMEEPADAGGFVFWRKWQAARPTSGPIKGHYLCSLPEPIPRSGPPFDLRVNGGGISGAGYGFLALPDKEGLFKLRLHWDLAQMESGSIGVTSLGEGDIETVGPIERVFASYFMAGRLGRFPKKGDINGFSSAWLGTPPFDAEEVMAWSAKAFTALKSFFRDTTQEAFRFFMRVGPDNSGVGGAGLYNSFMLFVPVEPELTDGARGTIAHEMIHKWVGGIKGSPGETLWFSEGLTVHYTRLLMFRAGLFSADEFLEDANGTVTRYLTNPLRNMPNNEIEKNFWQDRNAQVIPYDRGSLYFAHVDAKIRAVSKGKRSLDDVTLSMFDRSRNGEEMTREMWLELLKKELGPSALAEFEAVIIRGEDFMPDSDAFGPFFKRIAEKLRVFELGFDQRKSLYTSEKRITGLVKGSAAERAGLQEGDQVLNKIDLRALRNDENRRIKLEVRRGDEILKIEYLPRGESIDGNKWVRAADSPPMMSVTLKPGAADTEGYIGYVDVTIALQAADATAGEPLLMLPIVFANVETIAKTLQNFEAADMNGGLPMKVKDDPADSPVCFRRWIPNRSVKGDLIVKYRAPIDNKPPARSGPPFGLVTEGGGFSGAGNAFLLTPAAPTPCGLEIHWDLTALGTEASGTSSFGDGDVKISELGTAGRLYSTFFMAGPLHRYPEKPADSSFSSVWLGSPPFDPLPLMAWAERLHTFYRNFFKTEDEKPYRVFLRYNPINPNGGVGLYNSFVATFDRKTKSENLELLLAHEMLHTFAPRLNEGDSNRLDSTQWFDEGLAIFYQRLLPLRAGLIEPAEFLKDLNETAARYYTNALNTTPNDQIAPRFWEDTRIRVLPYDRGSMYLAVVNDRIRKASGGKRSLDDIVLILLDREKQGMTNSPELWIDLITEELGPSAREEFEAMLAGAVMLPESDAFGPCFKRVTLPLRRFELGFDPKVMNQQPRIIRGLVAGSEAERAGLRNGDEIVLPVGLDSVQGDRKRTLTLQIRHDGKVFPVTYLPRGETVATYQWARAPGIPDSECRY